MKTLLSILILACLSFGQGAPAANSYGFSYGFDLDRNFANGLLDTLAGSSDSITLLTKTSLNQGYDYILRAGLTTGSGNDSVEAIVRMDFFGNASDTSFIRSITVDTIKTALGEEIILPIYRSGFANKVSLKLLAGAANGGVVILNNYSLIRRKTVFK